MLFDKRVDILSAQQSSDGVWSWVATGKTWTAAERQKGSNLFSKVGLGARSVLFSMQPRPLTLHQAIQWKGQHYFITDIDRKSPVLMEVTCAAVTMTLCTARRLPTGVDENKRIIREPQQLCIFPAVLTEKYQGFEQKMPIAQVTQTFVLVTHKAVELQPGDLVDVEAAGTFVVHTAHVLDEYKNEYEIHRKGDI